MVHQIFGVITILPSKIFGLKAQQPLTQSNLRAESPTAPSPGQRPGYSEPVPLRPERAKALFTPLCRALGVASET